MADGDALRFTHGHLAAALSSHTAILIALDPAGLVLVWNTGAEQVFDLREDQILGQPFVRCPIAWDWDHLERTAPAGLVRETLRIALPFTTSDGRQQRVAFQVIPQFRLGSEYNGSLWLGSIVGPAPPRPPAPPPRAPERTAAPAPGIPAVAQDAAKLYPVHISFLESHLMAMGEDPQRWIITAADETRLDHQGMEVRFTLTCPKPFPRRMRRNVFLANGELVAIHEG